MSDLLQFADNKTSAFEKSLSIKKWKVLIVDDEADIHKITELVMNDFQFQGRKIIFLNAYSANEAREILKKNSDIAVILLDVVMETQTAGLDLIKFIRDDIQNKLTRIILRTGQPGTAPEDDVIINYDINDYKRKTDLTKSKLDTVLITAIRAYNHLLILNKSRKGLKKIIDASANIFETNSMIQFIEGILLQLTSMLKLEEDTIYLEVSAIAVNEDNFDNLKIVAGTGKYATFKTKTLGESVSPEVLNLLKKSYENKESFFQGNYYVGFFKSGSVNEYILLLEGLYEIESTDKYLIELFSRNINIAFENNYRNLESINTRDEIIYTLGEVSERHKALKTHHVQRVGEIAFRLAGLKGLSHEQAEEIKIAAAMHDVGKIFLNNDILEKNTELSEIETDKMQHHTKTGESILRNKKFHLLEKAADVAAQHHERWDGKGYPNQLKGDNISLSARIAAISLIYDALKHDQPYRKAWDESKIFDFIKTNSGKIFDPALVELFLNNYPLINEVNKMYPQ